VCRTDYFLGPNLFVLNKTDLVLLIERCVLFADDTQQDRAALVFHCTSSMSATVHTASYRTSPGQSCVNSSGSGYLHRYRFTYSNQCVVFYCSATCEQYVGPAFGPLQITDLWREHVTPAFDRTALAHRIRSSILQGCYVGLPLSS